MKVASAEIMPVIRSVIAGGQAVRLTVRGDSMRPFLRDGDQVELAPAPAPRVGDPVLVRAGRGPEARYLLHRVVRLAHEHVFVRGDAQRVEEGPFPVDDVIGRVTTILRAGRTLDLDRRRWRLAGRAWVAGGPMVVGAVSSAPARVAKQAVPKPVTRLVAYARSARWVLGQLAEPRPPELERLEALLARMPDEVATSPDREALAVLDELSEAARAHGLWLVLRHWFGDPSARTASSDPGDPFRRALVRDVLFRQALREITAALEKAQVPHFLLKGPTLAARLYPEPWLRPSSDLDLAIPRDGVERAFSALAQLGYEPHDAPDWNRWLLRHHHHVKVVGKGLPPLELHFTLNSRFGTRIESARFVARAIPCRLDEGLSIDVLPPEDELLYLCTHAAGHLFERLLWLLDLRLFLRKHPAIDLEAVLGRARALGTERACELALAQLDRIWGSRLLSPRRARPIVHRAALAAQKLYLRTEQLPNPRSRIIGSGLCRSVVCDSWRTRTALLDECRSELDLVGR